MSAFAWTHAIAFAAGYDIRTEDGYDQTMQEFDRLIGLGKIRAFHLNDSKKDLGCRVDRHCHIGKGCIGLGAFRFRQRSNDLRPFPKYSRPRKGPGIEEDC